MVRHAADALETLVRRDDGPGKDWQVFLRYELRDQALRLTDLVSLTERVVDALRRGDLNAAGFYAFQEGRPAAAVEILTRALQRDSQNTTAQQSLQALATKGHLPGNALLASYGLL